MSVDGALMPMSSPYLWIAFSGDTCRPEAGARGAGLSSVAFLLRTPKPRRKKIVSDASIMIRPPQEQGLRDGPPRLGEAFVPPFRELFVCRQLDKSYFRPCLPGKGRNDLSSGTADLLTALTSFVAWPFSGVLNSLSCQAVLATFTMVVFLRLLKSSAEKREEERNLQSAVTTQNDDSRLVLIAPLYVHVKT